MIKYEVYDPTSKKVLSILIDRTSDIKTPEGRKRISKFQSRVLQKLWERDHKRYKIRRVRFTKEEKYPFKKGEGIWSTKNY